jgi:hypothetical protein
MRCGIIKRRGRSSKIEKKEKRRAKMMTEERLGCFGMGHVEGALGRDGH